MAIVAASLIIAVLSDRGLIHTICLAICGVFWASFTNVTRIFVLGFALAKLDLDFVDGWRHDLLGVILFAIALVLVASTDQLLLFLLQPIRQSRTGSRLVRWWNHFMAAGIGQETSQASASSGSGSAVADLPSTQPLTMISFIFAVMCFVGMGLQIHYRLRDRAALNSQPPPVVDRFRLDSLPAIVDGWERVKFSTKHPKKLFAQTSRIWHYAKGNVRAVFSLDYTFHNWHDLTVCYRKIGWSQNGGARLIESPDGYFLGAQYFKDAAQGMLYYSHSHSDGKPFVPPDALSSLEQVRLRLANDQSLMQIQVWMTKEGDITPADRESAKSLFEELRRDIAGQLQSETQTPLEQ